MKFENLGEDLALLFDNLQRLLDMVDQPAQIHDDFFAFLLRDRKGRCRLFVFLDLLSKDGEFHL